MALDLSTPAAQLAWETATRNAEAKAQAEKYIADRTAMQNAAQLIAPYGGNAADYASQLGASDTAAQHRAAMADLYKNYVIGRPEMLTQMAQEAAARKRGTGGGSTTYSATLPDVSAIYDYLLGGVTQKPATATKPTRTVSPDTAEKWTPTAAPVRRSSLPSRFS